MADNPFSVNVPNATTALLLGQQSYDAAQKRQKDAAIDDARQQASQMFAAGDHKNALSTLLGAGDYQGANLAATQLQNQWTQQHTAQTDAEHAREFNMNYGLAKRTADRADDKTPAGFIKQADGSLAPMAGGPTDPAYMAKVAGLKAALPDDIVTYNAAKSQGYPGSLVDFIKEKKGPMVNIDQKAESEQGKAIGAALGKAQGADIEAGNHAMPVLRQLATLDNANKSGGDDISSGPFGELVLKGKQGLNEIAGEDLANAAPAEVIKKVGFGLATNLTKAITNRPAQMEFMKALENVPNLMMSKTGREAMTSIMSQEKMAEMEIGKLAARHRDVQGGPVWQEVKDQYYQQHPLISPFTGKPFSPADVDMVVKSAGGGSSTTSPGKPIVVNGYTITEH